MASEEDPLIPIVDQNTKSERAEGTVKSRLLGLTVEPVILLYFIYATPSLLIAEQYIFEIISLQNNYSKSVSPNISACSHDNSSESRLELQKYVQSQSSHVMLILSGATNVISIFTVILYGAYSDERGRKFALVTPLLGAIINCFVFILVIALKLNFWYLLIGTTIDGILGSRTSFLMACFAYIGDISSMKGRTLRVTIVEVAVGIAVTGSQLSSGYLIQSIGYFYPFIILLGANVINLIYILCFLPETRPRTGVPLKFFKADHYRRVFKLFTKDDGTKRKWKLQINMVILVLVGTATLAYLDPMVYFLKGRPLCFDEVRVGFYTGAASLAEQIGSLTAVKFLENILGNIGLMIMAGVSGICYMSILAFTEYVWVLAIATSVGIFSFLTVPMVRSISSKLVESHEQGALFAGIAAAESLSALIGISSFDSIYAATLYILPGFIFLVIAGMYLLGIILASLQLYLTRREVARGANLEEHD